MDVTAPEQPTSPTSSVDLANDEILPVNRPKVEAQEDLPGLRDCGVFSGLGSCQEEAICLVSDSEDESPSVRPIVESVAAEQRREGFPLAASTRPAPDSEADSGDESLPSIRAIAESIVAKQRRDTPPLGTAEAAPTNALSTTLSTSDMGDDLNEATRGPSARCTTLHSTNKSRQHSQSRRSASTSTAASVPIDLPVVVDTAIAAPAHEPASTGSSLARSQSVIAGKHSMDDIAKRSRDSTPAEEAGSEVVEEGDQDADASSYEDESSDGSNDDCDDDGDGGSDTASDGSENGSGRGTQYDSEYTPSDDGDREQKNGKNSRDDSDDDCLPPPKRSRITERQASCRTRSASESCSSSQAKGRSLPSPSSGVCLKPTPPTSQDNSCHESDSNGDGVPAETASFHSWLLRDVELHCAVVDGLPTLQLHFSNASLHQDRDHHNQSRCHLGRPGKGQRAGKGQAAGKGKRRWKPFSGEEDKFIMESKKRGDSWAKIYDEYNSRFTQRSQVSLQVHYSTVLKSRVLESDNLTED